MRRSLASDIANNAEDSSCGAITRNEISLNNFPLARNSVCLLEDQVNIQKEGE